MNVIDLTYLKVEKNRNCKGGIVLETLHAYHVNSFRNVFITRRAAMADFKLFAALAAQIQVRTL